MLFNNAPLMSDPEGTLRRRGVLNGGHDIRLFFFHVHPPAAGRTKGSRHRRRRCAGEGCDVGIG